MVFYVFLHIFLDIYSSNNGILTFHWQLDRREISSSYPAVFVCFFKSFFVLVVVSVFASCPMHMCTSTGKNWISHERHETNEPEMRNVIDESIQLEQQ